MKNKILTIIFIITIYSCLILNIIIPDKDISTEERRKLARFPDINYQNIIDSSFSKDFDDYVLDQFILRDKLRMLKSIFELNIYHKLDTNNIYILDNRIYNQEYILNTNSVINFTNKINNLYDKYLKNMNVYYTIIPDKNYYLNTNHPKLDYDKLYSITTSNLNRLKYIDITNCLNLDSYYHTDIHWKQEKLNNVVSTLAQNMNFTYTNNYTINKYYPFYGVYYHKTPTKVEPDTIYYLTNDIIDNVIVKDYESNLDIMYELESLGSIDSYDVYLSGATPIITIDNPNYQGKRELIIFRDSFSSSLAPLLISGYSKITLIDLRYMNSSSLEEYLEFNNQDVLIIYGTILVNNSFSIRG